MTMPWWMYAALWAFGSPIIGVLIGKAIKMADQRRLVEQRQHLKLIP